MDVARDSFLQIAEKKLEKKRKLAAQRKEDYKIHKETSAVRPTIIRSGFAFDAPTRLNSYGKENSGDAGARACDMQCVTSVAAP